MKYFKLKESDSSDIITNFLDSELVDNLKFKKSVNSNITSYSIHGQIDGYIDVVGLSGFNLIKSKIKVVVSSESLADPKLAYQNTSARIVDFKKMSLNKDYEFNDSSKAVKELEKYINKLKALIK